MKYRVPYFVDPTKWKGELFLLLVVTFFWDSSFYVPYCCWKESWVAHSVLRLEFAISFCTGKEQLQVRWRWLIFLAQKIPMICGRWGLVSVCCWRCGPNARRNLWSAKNFICLISVDFECTRRLHPVKRCLSVFKCFLLVLVFFFLVKTGDFRSSYPYFWSQNQLWLMCSLNLALGRLQVVMWSWNLKQPFWKEF